VSDTFSRRAFVRVIAVFGSAASVLGLRSSELNAAAETGAKQMDIEPEKAKHLKYLIVQVKDWHKDALALWGAIKKLPTASRRASPPIFELPPPPSPPPMSPNPANYEWCDAYFQTIAQNNYTTALGVLQVLPDPNELDIARPLNYDDVNSLDAANEWMRLTSSLFKSMIQFYPPQKPDPVPDPRPPEAGDDEDIFWTKLETELQSLAQDAMDFVEARFSGKAMQMPSKGSEPIPSKSVCIKRIEASAHQVFMDYCRISNHLPDHFQRLGAGGMRIFSK
jgi:hypothetical protein